jgi:hypothetical protein
MSTSSIARYLTKTSVKVGIKTTSFLGRVLWNITKGAAQGAKESVQDNFKKENKHA